MAKKIRHIPAGEFKAKCLQLMDEVAADGGKIIITKHGKPVAELVPCKPTKPALFGCMKGSVTYYGEIISQIEDDWEANA